MRYLFDTMGSSIGANSDDPKGINAEIALRAYIILACIETGKKGDDNDICEDLLLILGNLLLFYEATFLLEISAVFF